MIRHYDTIVIGSGGGTKLVRPVADLGKKVALFEKESPGGTCLNRGCIPSKMLIYPSQIIQQTRDLSRLQLTRSGDWQLDFSRLIERINLTIGEESASIPPIYEKHPNIDYYPHFARFVGPREIESQGERFSANRIFVAVGSRPKIPKIPGLENTPYWTSREALRADRLPRKMVVYGGGYIALELGMAFAGFGTQVQFVVRSQLLREQDHEIREALQKSISPYVKIHQGSTIGKVSYREGEFSVELSEGENSTITADCLLIATGIQPNTDDLGLEHTGISCDSEGYIQTNDFLETTEKNVFALGDCIGRYFFRHSVNFEGEYLFENLYKKDRPVRIHYPPVPSAVFTYPEIASVGLTEESCRSAGFDYISVLHPYSSSATGMVRLPKFGFVKILVDRSSNKVLGAHIIGDEASTLIHPIVLGMTLGIRIEDYLKMIYIHPSPPEIVRNAFRKARDILGDVT